MVFVVSEGMSRILVMPIFSISSTDPSEFWISFWKTSLSANTASKCKVIWNYFSDQAIGPSSGPLMPGYRGMVLLDYPINHTVWFILTLISISNSLTKSLQGFSNKPIRNRVPMDQSESKFRNPTWVSLRALSAILTSLINYFLYFVFFFGEQHFDFWLFPNILIIYFLQIQNSFLIFHLWSFSRNDFMKKVNFLKYF